MNADLMRVTGDISSGFSYLSQTQPYYICVPEYVGKPNGVSIFHKLCSALNMLGCQAYLEAWETNGELWTPLLTEGIKVAHFKAGKKPIVVSSGEITGNLNAIGLQVKYLQSNTAPESSASPGMDVGPVVYLSRVPTVNGIKSLFLPVIDIESMRSHNPLPQSARAGIAFLQAKFLEAGGKCRDFGVDAIDLSAPGFENPSKMCEALCKVTRLYVSEPSEIIDLARLFACPVVLLPNTLILTKLPDHLVDSEKMGVAWGEEAHEFEWACETVVGWREIYLQKVIDWEQGLRDFVADTQQQASALTLMQSWPQSSVDLLEIKTLTPEEQGARADRNKYKRVNEQFKRWSKHCTIREIDADIYAEHISAGNLPAISVLIDQRGCSLDALAETLDSLSQCLWQPANLVIVSEQGAPDEFDSQSGMYWLTVSADDKSAFEGMRKRLSHWVLLVQSGTRLAAQSLVEWGLAVDAFQQSELIYADEDFSQTGGVPQHPFFKPSANVELMRCTNYLGSAVLARSLGWTIANCPLFDGGLYGYALQLLKVRGRSALGHVDTILAHSTGAMLDETESKEYSACIREMAKGGLATTVRPLERLGTWLVDYLVPSERCVSLVVPTGLQTGYLRSLLESLELYPQENLAEIILVCAPDQVYEVEYALANVTVSVPLTVVELDQENYSHSAALNAGVARASAQYILVCDDDIETLHANWLSSLLGISMQSDVGCVAPRLMANRGVEARVIGGPMVMGINGTAAPYNGEMGSLFECGVQSRLQLTQDVGCVAGHCFVFRKQDWAAVGGFDPATFLLWYTVLDFCLRLGELGKRHVWTPLASVMHQGGKTVGALAGDPRSRLKMADSELTERNFLLKRWSEALANDACYNRHLSLVHPFDVENTIVVDWQPKRKDRPRVLACPTTSGGGQYRVVEPLNALQDAGLAQTCAVIPTHRGQNRILQPLELVRAAPDCLMLQHSVDDGQLGMIEKYKMAMPHIKIIQTSDDLLGDVPIKHPNRIFQVREGHQRMAQALKKSDRLIVTTEALRQHYKKYVKDVWLLPNCLDKQWSSISRPKATGGKLRVGWVGAGQHKGDLELVTGVVRELAGEVDWVFMGMCTDEIRLLIKEYHGFVSITDYPSKMASLKLDIAIAPLESNFFNECKSNLRLLEYGAMGWPVVCSDVYPYQTLNPPVLRCSDSATEWVTALRKLMDDAEMRSRMGAELHAWVQENFLLSNKVLEWRDAIFGDAILNQQTSLK